jgi:hypothetical protein
MSFLRKLLGLGESSPDTVITGIDAASFPGRRRHLEIVGEFYHQPALNKVLGSDARAGVNLTTVAALVPNPGHPQDKNAVEVRIDGHLVGYLSRDQAVGYHKAMRDAGYEGRALGNVEARIFGRPLDRDGHGGFGVALYLPDSLAKVIGVGERPGNVHA